MGNIFTAIDMDNIFAAIFGVIFTAIFGDGVEYITGEEITGYPNKIIDELKRRLRKYSRGASVEYIGIASGRNGKSAMRSCYDDYMKTLGINEMRVLYKSSSYTHVQQIERQLIDYSREINAININQTGGGGDIPNIPGHYFVYVAYNRQV